MSTITPLQALRRLVDIARLIDADECPEFYNQLQGELTVAGAVLATQADDFAHFLSYSGLSAESEEVKEKLQRAFEAGQPSSTIERFWNAVERRQTAQPPEAAQDARDSARYRFLCDNAYRMSFDLSESQEYIDRTIDAAITATKD